MCVQDKLEVMCVCNEAQSLPCPSVRKSVPLVLSKHISFAPVRITRVKDKKDIKEEFAFHLFPAFSVSAFICLSKDQMPIKLYISSLSSQVTALCDTC